MASSPAGVELFSVSIKCVLLFNSRKRVLLPAHGRHFVSQPLQTKCIYIQNIYNIKPPWWSDSTHKSWSSFNFFSTFSRGYHIYARDLPFFTLISISITVAVRVGVIFQALGVYIGWWSGSPLFYTVYPHDHVITWKHFTRYWPFVRGIHRWPVDFHHRGL